MIDGYRVVAVTPAGRRRYLSILLPYVLRAYRDGLIDEYRLFLNTDEPDDVAWCERAAERLDFIALDRLPIGSEPSIYQISRMYAGLTDPGTIYLRIDDDIVFIARDAIERLLWFRIEHPEDLLCLANTINNAICSWVHQRMGLIDPSIALGYKCMDRVGWADPSLAEDVHRRFLDRLEVGRLAEYDFRRWVLLGRERFSINAFAFMGRHFAGLDVPAGVDEEWWLTERATAGTGRYNAICGGAVVVHFAFHPQREYLDATGLLERYEAVMRRECPDEARIVRGIAA